MLVILLCAFCAASSLATVNDDPQAVVIVLDESGSMRGLQQGYTDITPQVKAEFERILSDSGLCTESGDVVSLITFGETVDEPVRRLLSDTNHEECLDSLVSIVNASEYSDSHTYHEGAFIRAMEECSSITDEYPNHRTILLFLTDGGDDPPAGCDSLNLEEHRSMASTYEDYADFVVFVDLRPDTLQDSQAQTDIEMLIQDVWGHDYIVVDGIDRLLESLREILVSSLRIIYDNENNVIPIELSSTNRTDEACIWMIIEQVEFSRYREPPEDGFAPHVRVDTIIEPDYLDGVSLRCTSYVEPGFDNRLRIAAEASIADGVPSWRSREVTIRPELDDTFDEWSVYEDYDFPVVSITISRDTVLWCTSSESAELSLSELGAEDSVTFEIHPLPQGYSQSEIRLELDENALPDEVELDVSCEVMTSTRAEVTVRASCAEEIPNGTYEGTLYIGMDTEEYSVVPSELEVTIFITTRMIPPAWPRTLAWIVGVILLVVIAIALFKWYTSRKLFGRMTFYSGSKRLKKDLSKLGLKSSIGGQGIVLPGVSEVLATLEVEKYDGNRFVKLTPAAGAELVMNGKRQAHVYLHNHDRVELANWTIEYKGRTVSRRATR